MLSKLLLLSHNTIKGDDVEKTKEEVEPGGRKKERKRTDHEIASYSSFFPPTRQLDEKSILLSVTSSH